MFGSAGTGLHSLDRVRVRVERAFSVVLSIAYFSMQRLLYDLF
jgi:hypothetical protein